MFLEQGRIQCDAEGRWSETDKEKERRKAQGWGSEELEATFEALDGVRIEIIKARPAEEKKDYSCLPKRPPRFDIPDWMGDCAPWSVDMLARQLRRHKWIDEAGYFTDHGKECMEKFIDNWASTLDLTGKGDKVVTWRTIEFPKGPEK
jgi:hypothetical protein